MKKYPFLNLALSNAPLMDDLKTAACDVIESGRYLHGTQTELLEEEIAQLCQARHCVSVSNGLDALRLILRAYKEMGIMHDGDEVIVPANTYVASVLAISDNGLRPVLCDIREDTMNMDSGLLDGLITERTRAIMPVHLYGTPCWDNELMRVAREHDLRIIEDNAQAIGAVSDTAGLNGTFVTGGLGDAGAHFGVGDGILHLVVIHHAQLAFPQGFGHGQRHLGFGLHHLGAHLLHGGLHFLLMRRGTNMWCASRVGTASAPFWTSMASAPISTMPHLPTGSRVSSAWSMRHCP